MITPEDIKNQQFEVAFKGYKTREVDDFLDVVHSDLRDLYEEMDFLRRKVAASELLVEEAKNHEDEFIASLQNDKEKAEQTLASAKAEGERIIREAKNAAAGIMAEVRRRAGDISTESRKASSDMIDDAKKDADTIRAEAVAEAAAITENAKAEADRRLFSARTESENTVKAAKAEAEAILSEAAVQAEALTVRAAESAAVHEKYIREVRAAAEKLCFELDAELKNSASRIALLGRKISSADIPDTAPEAEKPSVPTVRKATARPAVKETQDIPAHAGQPFSAPEEPEKAEEPSFTEDEPSAKEDGPHGGYFSHEYRLAMTELFGEDANGSVPPAMDEDDDTYDYLDHADYSMGSDNDEDEYEDENDSEGNGIVTSEYTGIPGGSNKSSDFSDIFGNDTLERVFRSPTPEDISDILNG